MGNRWEAVYRIAWSDAGFPELREEFAVLKCDLDQDGLAVELGPWAPGAGPAGSEAFGVRVDGELLTARSPQLEVRGLDRQILGDGVEETVVRYERADAPALAVEWHVQRRDALDLAEAWVVVRNLGPGEITVDRLDSVRVDVASDGAELRSFTSSWGLEFEPVNQPLTGDRTLQTLAGRSSKNEHPWFALVRPDGVALAGAPVWSGNWVFRFEETPRGHRLSGGLHDEGFAKKIGPGEHLAAPHVVLATGADLDAVSVAFARVAREKAPTNELANALPVEWNTWWTYEDHSIDEQVFRANVDVAAELGVEVCTLDAGWFGPSDTGSHWTDHRGDWDHVNAERFPSGLRSLSDYVHERGMRFGLWCEIEAIGPKAYVAERRPDLPASRDGKPLGLVCFGNPDAAQWAYETLDRLVSDEGADWIKLDFNLDPGLGCNRTDHGHGPDDGLFEHYRGYYGVLTRVRERHPDVVLENCSSGGLRIDLGMLRQTHLTFLSDPDWPEHGLQLLWGASLMLPPNLLLHWGFSEWYGDHRHQTFDPRDPELQPHQVDYYRRIAMVGSTGLSWGLPNLPENVRERLASNNRTYKELVRPFVRDADLHRLTGQPKRFGEGDRWAGFQYARADGSSHLALLFRLPGGENERTIALRGLAEDAEYDVRWLDADRRETRGGGDLMSTGLRLELPEEGSEIVVLERR